MKLQSSKIQNKKTALYFHEVSAIPLKTRNEYLEKLTKRLHSERQKNVRLLKMIYLIIENDELNLWNSEEVCNALCISMNQLYWHKHKILKGLRELYFGWEKIEKEIQKEIEKSVKPGNNQKKKKYSNSIHYLLIKAKNMNRAGMRKEAKNIFLSLSNTFEWNFRDKSPGKDEVLMLSEVYEYILQYYYEQRNLVGYNLFLKKLKILVQSAVNKKSGLTNEQRSLLKIRSYYAEAYKHKFHNYNNTSVYMVKEYLEKALYEARRIDHTHYKIFILYKIYLVAEKLNKGETIKDTLHEGYRLSGKNGHRIENIAYKSSLAFQEFKNSETKDVKYLKELKKYFKESGDINPVNQCSIYCAENYIKVLIHFKPQKFKTELNKLIKRQVLFSQTAIARWNLYQLKPRIDVFYSYDIIKDDITKKDFVTAGKVYYDILKKREELANEALLRLKNVHSVNFKIHILIDLLQSEFWKGKNCDFEKALSIIRKIEWVKKTKKIQIRGQEVYSLMKLGIYMMYESKFHRKNEVLDKYLANFIKISTTFLKETISNILAGYSLISLVARELDCKEVWSIVKRHYSRMEENHPKLVRQLKKYIIDNKKRERANWDTSKAT